MKNYFQLIFIYLILFSFLLFANSCTTQQKKIDTPQDTKKEVTTSEKLFVPKIIRILPHNTESYTQGLLFHEGVFYESTGQYGSSKLMKVDILTGKALKSVSLLPIYFGEGLMIMNETLYQLTWENQKGFIYNTSLEKIGEFNYPGEGWGITCDSASIIISDGSNFLNFYNPANFELQKTLMVVRSDNTPVYNLNELEYINGKIFANVFMADEIVIINPQNGIVEGSVDITSLKLQLDYPESAEVANGIAYNHENGHYYFTGKYWSNIFEVELTEK